MRLRAAVGSKLGPAVDGNHIAARRHVSGHSNGMHLYLTSCLEMNMIHYGSGFYVQLRIPEIRKVL